MRGRTKQIERPEPVRRLESLKKTLGLSEAKLGFLWGKQQGAVNRVMNSEEPGTLKPEMVEVLAHYLRQPDKVPPGEEVPVSKVRPPIAEQFSPLLVDCEGVSKLALSVLDKEISPEEWDESLAGHLFASSKAPFRPSVLIKDREEAYVSTVVEGLRRAPKAEAFLADLKVHGEEFVQRMRAEWHARDVMTKAESDGLLYAAKGAGGSILIHLALELERMGFPKIASENLDPFREGPFDLEEVQRWNLEQAMGPSWTGKPEKFIPAMEFLAVIADWVKDLEKVALVPLLDVLREGGQKFAEWSSLARERSRGIDALAEDIIAEPWASYGTSVDAKERETSNAPQA